MLREWLESSIGCLAANTCNIYLHAQLNLLSADHLNIAMATKLRTQIEGVTVWISTRCIWYLFVVAESKSHLYLQPSLLLHNNKHIHKRNNNMLLCDRIMMIIIIIMEMLVPVNIVFCCWFSWFHYAYGNIAIIESHIYMHICIWMYRQYNYVIAVLHMDITKPEEIDWLLSDVYQIEGWD